MKKGLLVTLFFISALGISCSDKSKPNVELIQDMMDTVSLKAQEYDEASPDNRGMRLPPEHTVPVGFIPYAYKNNIDGANANKNPLASDMSGDVLLVGEKYYFTHCALCHGMNGEGSANSSIAQKMALKPPALTTDKAKGFSDGRLYHIITVGQGIMGPYASHIPQKYRWQVVNYIRHLQKNN